MAKVSELYNNPDYTGADTKKYVDKYTNRPEDMGGLNKVIAKAWNNFLASQDASNERMNQEIVPGSGITHADIAGMVMGSVGSTGNLKFAKGLLSFLKPSRTKELIKKYGKNEVKEMVRRGISYSRKEAADPISRVGGQAFNIKPPKHLTDEKLSKFNPWKEIRGLDKPSLKGIDTRELPSEFQKWKVLETLRYLNPSDYGRVTKSGYLFVNPKLGQQLSVNKARHLAKKSSGGYGHAKFKIPVEGKGTVTVRGPWSSRPSMVRAKGMKDFRGWQEMPYHKRYKSLQSYIPDWLHLKQQIKHAMKPLKPN